MLALLAVLAALLLAVAKPLPDPGHALLHGTFGGATKCLAVKGGILRNGTPVVITECKTVQTQSWAVAHDAPGMVRVAGTRYCLDAGTDPANGHKVRIWACDDNVPPQQNWFWTDDNRLALTGLGLCLDNTDGREMNGNQAQVWRCSDGNTNQVWGAPDRGPCGPFPCTTFPFPRPSHKPGPRPSHRPRR